MCDKGHRYFKFDEASVVCRRCGEQKVVDVHALLALLPSVTYMPCPGPHYPAWQPYQWPGFTWSVSGTNDISSLDTNVTIYNGGSNS